MGVLEILQLTPIIVINYSKCLVCDVSYITQGSAKERKLVKMLTISQNQQR